MPSRISDCGLRVELPFVTGPNPRSALRNPQLVLVALLAAVLVSCGPGVPYGKVQMGEVTTKGVVDLDYLEAQLVPLEPRFQACYAQALRRNRTSEGVIHFSLEGGGGRLIPKVLGNSTHDEGLTSCVTQAIAGLSIVERGAGPWAFTAEWSVEFQIARRKPATD